MNKAESKYFNTAVRMDEALLALLEKKEFAYISVKEICEEAQVNRSTFYLHYENTGDLLAETLEHVNRRFMGYFQADAESTMKKIQSGSLQDLIFIAPEYLVPYLTFIRDNSRLFMAAIKRPDVYCSAAKYNALYRYLFAPVFDRFRLPEEERKYTLDFYVNGIMGVVTEWISGGCKTDIRRMSQIIAKLVLSKEDLQER